MLRFLANVFSCISMRVISARHSIDTQSTESVFFHQELQNPLRDPLCRENKSNHTDFQKHLVETELTSIKHKRHNFQIAMHCLQPTSNQIENVFVLFSRREFLNCRTAECEKSHTFFLKFESRSILLCNSLANL